MKELKAMKFYVSPPNKTSWSMSPAEFVARLLERWPNARVKNLPNSEFFSHEWEVQMPDSVLEGRFYRDGRAVALDGDLLDCVDIALWFRSLAPPNQELWFYDQEYSAHVNLKGNTNAATIAAAFE